MSLSNYKLKRAGDQNYYIKDPSNTLIKFRIGDKKIGAESAYCVAENAIKLYLEQLEAHEGKDYETIRFTFGGKKWKLIPADESKWYSFILKFFQIIFFHKQTDHHKEFKIERAWFAPKREKSEECKEFRKQWKADISKSQMDSFEALNSSISGTHLGRVTSINYAQGIRAIINVSDDFVYPPYQDPFTQLATWAFQRFEPVISAKDGFAPLDCQYRLIKIAEELILVDVNSALATTEAMSAAVIAYQAYIEKYYGAEKLKYIDHLYGLDLRNMTELSPEHIFRVNCGTTNVEIHDVKTGVKLLKCAAEALGEVASDTSFFEFAKNYMPLALAVKVACRFGDENPTVLHFSDWIDKCAYFNSAIEEIDPDSFNELINLFYPNKIELNLAYTGKKIRNVLQGSYASGEYQDFKPWIDQQELTQVSQKLIKCTSVESYFEQLSFIVVKKHLARSHPEDLLRVGALIPSYPIDGKIHWYKVSSCSTNQYNYSYTLESVCNDPELPAVVLCRNTAACPYALYSSKSIQNDLGFFPPGYMGVDFLDKKTNEFYQKRTIPLWVGYLYSAENKTDQEEIFTQLAKSQEALIRSLHIRYKTMSFREVLKKHDMLLNELYLRNDFVLDFAGKSLSPEYLRLIKELITKYIDIPYESYNDVEEGTIRADALALKVLISFAIDPENEREIVLGQVLCTDLDEHILDAKANAQRQTKLKNEIDSINSLQNLTDLNAWAQNLKRHAIRTKEDIESKLNQSLAFAGQSLGGGLAQILLTRHLSNQERIPLPGRSCSLYEFDAPGIEEEDNQKFLAFGNNHCELLNELKIENRIVRSQEKGDIVPTVGEEHLGAVFSTAEKDQTSAWLQFDASLNQRLKSAKRKEIAFSSMVHDTLFLEGKFVKGEISLKNKKIKKIINFDEDHYDYIKLTYDAHIQGIFDTHGKKGEFQGPKGEEMYEYLRNKIWKQPWIRVDEHFRKSTDYVATSIRRMLLSERFPDRTFPNEAHNIYGTVYVA